MMGMTKCLCNAVYVSRASVKDSFLVDLKFCLSSDNGDLGRIQRGLFLKRCTKWQMYQTVSAVLRHFRK